MHCPARRRCRREIAAGDIDDRVGSAKTVVRVDQQQRAVDVFVRTVLVDRCPALNHTGE